MANFFYRYLDTIFHMLKASLGTGILAMPNAFHNAGYAVGLIGTLTIGFLCTYNIHMLVRFRRLFLIINALGIPFFLALSLVCQSSILSSSIKVGTDM